MIFTLLFSLVLGNSFAKSCHHKITAESHRFLFFIGYFIGVLLNKTD